MTPAEGRTDGRSGPPHGGPADRASEPELPPVLAGSVLVTGNPGKLAEARRLCGAALEAIELELPEIQSLDLHEVLRAKAATALERLGSLPGRPLVVEETGLELTALGGFPGPLVRWMLAAVGADGIARTAVTLDDPTATARCALLWTDGAATVIAEGVTAGRLVLPPRGDGGFGWDPVFEPQGHSLTYAEMPPEVKDQVGHRGRAWRELAGRLAERAR